MHLEIKILTHSFCDKHKYTNTIFLSLDLNLPSIARDLSKFMLVSQKKQGGQEQEM